MPGLQRRWAIVAAAVLIAASVEVRAQVGIATGTLQGSVSDALGSPLAGVTVTASNSETGFVRAQRTDDRGRFQIRLLPPGLYSVHAALEGFAPSERRGIRLQVGEAPALAMRLELPTVTDLLVVTQEAPLVETTRASATDTVDSRAIESLPLDGRNFSDLMLLVPQVGEYQGRPFVAGAEGMMNSFNVDGADSNSLFFGEQLGGILPPFTYSQAAVQEFQVLRSSYNVRFGGASGGIVNAVTRSGTNRLRGGAFLFFQDDGMVATDALGNDPVGFERRQLGLSIGGPLRRDRLHFFVAYDSQRRDQNALRRPLSLSPELEPAFDAKLESLGIDAATEFDYLITNDTEVLLLKLDWSVDDSHRLWLRHNLSDQGGDNSTFGFMTSGWSNLGREENRFYSSVGSLASVLGPRAFNEAVIQISPARRPRQANFTAIPQTLIGFFDAVFGQGMILPSFLDEDRVQVQDNLMLEHGDHSLRFGFDYSHLEFDNSYLFQRGGYYYLPSYEEFLAEEPCTELRPGQSPCIFIQSFSPVDGRVGFDTQLLSVYAGDTWRPGPRLTVEYGLRLEHQENPPPQNPNPLEPRTELIPDDTNLAPRFGFAWDLKGDGRSVLRGGAGVFTNWTPSLLVANAMLGNGVNGATLTLFQGFGPFFPEYPNRLPPEAAAFAVAPPNLSVFAPDFENPETTRFSLGFERAVSDSFKLGAEITYSESRHRVRQWDVNLDPTPLAFLADGRPVYGGQSARLDPRFGQILQFSSDADAEYSSLVLSAKKRQSRNWTLQANYTYSESRDHESSETDFVTAVAEDHFDLDQDWGWSDRDARHRIVVCGSYAAPHGLTFSFIGRYRSAGPINAFAGQDLNNDGFFVDRPGPDPTLGLDRHLDRNAFRGSSAAAVDLRLAKSFRHASRHEIEAMVEVFNVTDEANFTAFDTDFLRFGQPNPEFGEPRQAGPPRTLQLGLRYRF